MKTDKTFPLSIEGIGQFAFRHRTLRDDMRIASEYSRLTEGVETPTKALDVFADIVSTLKVLSVEAPKGWTPAELDDMDPLDPETYTRLVSVYNALREKETFFRQTPSRTG